MPHKPATVLAWHFVGETLRDGSLIPPDGVPLAHDGELVMCESGLHASERLIDALQFAPGATICRVECSGRIKRDTDKLVASRRTILWRVDGMEILRSFARQCALDVAHLWQMPAVVRQYLETGDKSLMAAASDAAWADFDAWDARATKDAEAASAAASAAAWATRTAASATPWADAGAFWADVGATAWAAALATKAAKNAAASDADWATARAAQNKQLTALVEAKRPPASPPAAKVERDQ